MSERTAATWKSKGMPVTADGKYPLAAIRHWRLQQPEYEEWLFRGNKDLSQTEATGDLARAILRWIRTELPVACSRAQSDFMKTLGEVGRSDDEIVFEALSAALAKHLEGFRLNDEVIEQLLVETWSLV